MDRGRGSTWRLCVMDEGRVSAVIPVFRILVSATLGWAYSIYVNPKPYTLNIGHS